MSRYGVATPAITSSQRACVAENTVFDVAASTPIGPSGSSSEYREMLRRVQPPRLRTRPAGRVSASSRRSGLPCFTIQQRLRRPDLRPDRRRMARPRRDEQARSRLVESPRVARSIPGNSDAMSVTAKHAVEIAGRAAQASHASSNSSSGARDVDMSTPRLYPVAVTCASRLAASANHPWPTSARRSISAPAVAAAEHLGGPVGVGCSGPVVGIGAR